VSTRERERRRLGGQDGQVTPFVVVFCLALVLLAGLVLDGGALLTAKREAIAVAEQAARAAAQAVDTAALRADGTQRLDPREATIAARRYLAATSFTGQVQVSGTEVTVTVTRDEPLRLLTLAGLRASPVTGAATARAVRGVTGAGT
jgi:Flp pilus assembly protein TadG